MTSVNVATDFTRFPSGRLIKNGNTSGEAFRSRFLEQPIAKGEKVAVYLDGTIGYGSSFLEEAFGGLVRVLNLSSSAVLNLLDLHSEDPSLIEEITGYIRDAGNH